MAETTANDVARRYAVIEQAYSKEDWALVLRDGEELLQQLRQTDNPQLLGLLLRLQLLLGHTHLYGYADRAAAARCYGAVASESIEAPLTKIAEQGLKECQAADAPAAEDRAKRAEAPVTEPASPSAAALAQPVAAQAQPAAAPVPFGGPAEPALATPAPAAFAIPGPAATPGTASAKKTSPAAPWLTEAALETPAAPPTRSPNAAEFPSPAEALPTATGHDAPWMEESRKEESLIPEVVEEPELIELHQADPALAEEVDVSWQEPSATPAAEGPRVTLAKDAPSEDDEELLGGLLLVRIG